MDAAGFIWAITAWSPPCLVKFSSAGDVLSLQPLSVAVLGIDFALDGTLYALAPMGGGSRNLAIYSVSTANGTATFITATSMQPTIMPRDIDVDAQGRLRVNDGLDAHLINVADGRTISSWRVDQFAPGISVFR